MNAPCRQNMKKNNNKNAVQKHLPQINMHIYQPYHLQGNRHDLAQGRDKKETCLNQFF